MSERRTHHMTTGDGVPLGAAVHGSGPPLVFLQGIIGDGDLDWGRPVEHLAGRFTCHLPSLRGRGLSGDSSDLGFDRLVDDVLDYLDSLGEPAGLVGWSLGGGLALAAAARSDAVVGVAAFEPGMLSLMDERERAALMDAVARTAALAAEGRSADAARAFAGWTFDDDELAAADADGYFDAAGRYAPALLEILRQAQAYRGPAADDPAVLGAVSAPVEVLLGSATRPFFALGARHVAAHVPDGRVREIPGAGHAAPLTHPEALAAALTDVFAPAPTPA